MSKYKYIPLLVIGTLALSGCSRAKESLGLTKEAPDEFSVVRHAPLAMPPSLALPPPRPGQPRPQEMAVTAQAKQVIFGAQATPADNATSDAESSLLQKTGATKADPNIRGKLDAESDEYANKNQPVIDKLLNIGSSKKELDKDTGETLNPKTEYDRLQKQSIPTGKSSPKWEDGKSIK